MTRIVTHAYRPKRARKRKAQAAALRHGRHGAERQRQQANCAPGLLSAGLPGPRGRASARTPRRLQASLVATHRAEGSVRHEHIGALGSVPRSPSPADRIEFWTKLHQRLASLSNRIDGPTDGAVLAAVHARIPMPTSDDQQALQIECARADARSMHGAYGPRFELRKLVRALNEERRRLLEQVK